MPAVQQVARFLPGGRTQANWQFVVNEFFRLNTKLMTHMVAHCSRIARMTRYGAAGLVDIFLEPSFH